MTVTVLVSPAATGKTQHSIQRILEHRTPETTWIVLPDQFQVASYRRRLAASGGAFGVQVSTFGGLYYELLRLARDPTPVASDALMQRLLRAAIEEVNKRGELAHFEGISSTPGFLRVLQARFSELKRAQIRPEGFARYAKKHSPSLQEVASIYQAYEKGLEELGWVDPPGLNWRAVAALEAHPGLPANWPILVVDGFGTFVPSQLTAIRLLGERVDDVWVTLPGSPGSERTAFRRFRRELDQLLEAVPNAEILRLEGEPRLPAPINHVEGAIFDRSPQKSPSEPTLEMLEARTPIEESREALRWIKDKHVRDDVPLASCAIVTPNPRRYRLLLGQAADEMGVPIRFSGGEPLATAPSVEALLDLLELQPQNWPRRHTLEAIRNPFFDLSPFGLAPETSAQLEAVSQVGRVIEGLDQWREALEGLAGDSLEEEAIDEDYHFNSAPRGSSAIELLRSLEGLDERLRSPEARSTTAWIQWLEDLMGDLGYPGEGTSPSEKAAQVSLREVLHALAQAEAIAGEREKSCEVFLRELRFGIEGASFEQKVSWRRPHVIVLNPLEARGLRFGAVAVMGLSEGLFPEIEREDPFFDEATRADLHLEPRLNREQAGLFYQAVTRADRFTLLTRPYLADDGEAWEASPFWDAVRVLLDDDPARISPEQPRPLPDAASVQDVLFWGVRRGKLPRGFLHDLGDRWEQLRHARLVLEARLAAEPLDRHEGLLSELEGLLQDRFGDDHTWSASRLESYGTCPYSFFIKNGLEIEPQEPPELGYDAAQLGAMLHTVLEETYRSVADPSDLDQLRESLHRVADAVFAKAPERYGFRPTPLWEIEQETLRQSLEGTLEALEDDNGDWIPFEYELRFGIEDEPVMMEGEGERFFLRGIIDRIDRDGQGNLRVLDYKTGSSHLSPRDLIEGRRLQIPLYAHAAGQLGLGKPTEGMYWMIQRAARSPFRMSNFRAGEQGEFRGPDGAMALAKDRAFQIVRNVQDGSFPPVAPRGGCPEYCPATGWCWRYVEGWKPS